MKKLTIALSTLFAATTLMTTIPAFADPGPVAHHPRVTQVNGRRDNQDDRIRNDFNNHNLTHRQVRSLDHQERQLGMEERDMRSMDDGHLTRADQRSLNQQLNHTNREIYRDAHQGN